MIFSLASDIGKVRKNNEDFIDAKIICKDDNTKIGIFALADGMGGHRAGDKASSYSVTRFVELARKTERELPFLSMEKILKQVNKEVFQLSQREEEYSGMGTTFVVATVVDKVVYVMNVGDSRLYYYDGKLKQVTMDHSLVEELVRAGELNRLESRNHPQKNIITKAVGVSETIQPDFFMLDIEEGEKILLCSDGLTNMVDDEKLEEIMSEPEELNQMAQECINEALFYGGLDNIAVVIAQYGNGR